MMTVGERIKSARKLVGLSQRALAAKIGVSAMAVSKWEHGMGADSGRLLQIGEACGVKFGYFVRQPTVTLSDIHYHRSEPVSRDSPPIREERDWVAYLRRDDVSVRDRVGEFLRHAPEHLLRAMGLRMVPGHSIRLWHLALDVAGDHAARESE